MGRIVTFYSYKGGTGRSMALANIAWVFASQGAKVLVVDWDLEAPGLHRYFRPFLLDKELTRLESQGVIDFVIAYTERLAASAAGEQPPEAGWSSDHADISKWSQRLLWPTGEDAVTTRGGYIDFVPAGRQGPQYANRVNSFDWRRFYDRCNGGAFMDAVRASMSKYDWVLIDSRTGVSDTAGICTVQFPDTLVVCFTLNYQSIDGAAAVAASAQAARTNRPLRILPLPTRLDGNEEKLLAAMMGYAQRAFNPLLEQSTDVKEHWEQMGVPYFSRYAYSEKLAPFETHVNVSTSTLPAVERLATSLNDGRAVKLVPLPEPHRAQVLAEFERLPGAVSEPIVLTATTRSAAALVAIRQALFRLTNVAMRPAVLGTVAVLLLAGVYFLRSSAVPDVGPAIARLADDAMADIRGNRRDRAALLIAEAASRLGGDAIVSAQAEPGKRVYDAFRALQPLKIGAPNPSKRVDIVLFSPNGRRFATVVAGGDNLLFEFPPQFQSVGQFVGDSAAAFSPDSRYVAANSDGRALRVFDANDGRPVWEGSPSDGQSIRAILFSLDGNLLVAAYDSERLLVVRVGQWRELGAVSNSQGGYTTMAFSSDSEFLALGSGLGGVSLWNTKTPSIVNFPDVRKPDGDFVRRLAFSANPRRLAVGTAEGEISVSSINSDGSTVLDYKAKGSPVSDLGFSQDGSVLAVIRSQGVQLLASGDPRQGAVVAELPIAGMRSLVFSGSRLIVGGDDRTVRVLDLKMSGGGAELTEVQKITLSSRINSVAVHPTGRFIAIAADDGVYITFLESPDFTFPAGEVQGLACSQAAEASLSAEDWQRYFGSEPLRFTCRPSTGSQANPFSGSFEPSQVR